MKKRGQHGEAHGPGPCGPHHASAGHAVDQAQQPKPTDAQDAKPPCWVGPRLMGRRGPWCRCPSFQCLSESLGHPACGSHASIPAQTSQTKQDAKGPHRWSCQNVGGVKKNGKGIEGGGGPWQGGPLRPEWDPPSQPSSSQCQKRCRGDKGQLGTELSRNIAVQKRHNTGCHAQSVPWVWTVSSCHRPPKTNQ